MVLKWYGGSRAPERAVIEELAFAADCEHFLHFHYWNKKLSADTRFCLKIENAFHKKIVCGNKPNA